MRKILAAAAIAALLAGCSSPSGGPQAGTAPGSTSPSGPDPLSQIAGFAVSDLTAAEAEAIAQGDTLAAPCYPALVQWVQALQSQAGTVTGGFQVKGGLSAFQAARGVRMKVEAGIGGGLKSIVPTQVKLACSALLLDEQNFLLRLAALAGAGAATAGVAPAAGGLLPGLLPKFP